MQEVKKSYLLKLKERFSDKDFIDNEALFLSEDLSDPDIDGETIDASVSEVLAALVKSIEFQLTCL